MCILLLNSLQAGYLSLCTLSLDELLSLRLLIAMRLAVSLVKGAAAALADPTNSDYLLMTQRYGWDLLRAMHSASDQEVIGRLQETNGTKLKI